MGPAIEPETSGRETYGCIDSQHCAPPSSITIELIKITAIETRGPDSCGASIESQQPQRVPKHKTSGMCDARRKTAVHSDGSDRQTLKS